MSIRDYIKERTYHYRIKTIHPIDDEVMAKIEKAIVKYDPLSVSRPRKTILQSQPLDFPHVENAEVFIVDIELEVPASPFVLQGELRTALGIPEKFIIVRGDNDPLEIRAEQMEGDAKTEDAARGAPLGSLLTLEKNEEAEDVDPTTLYGDVHNARLLGYLKRVQAERKTEVDAPNPLFKWMDMPDRANQEPVQDGTDFNAGRMVGDDGKPLASTSVQGNLDDDGRSRRRVFARSGKAEIHVYPYDTIRKTK